jgi:hypothetical protein
VTRLRKTLVITFAVLLAGAGASASALAVPSPAQHATIVAAAQATPNDLADELTGTWYNELGSRMKLTATADGMLSGSYYSAVGEATDYYVLTGRFDSAPPSGEGVSVGWTVTFYNSKLNAQSTATWSGQYFAGSQPEIVTQWLLTTSSTTAAEWQATNVGHDEFTRTPPSAAAIAQARATGRGSVFPQSH